MKFGPAVGALGTGLLIAKFGWRPVFIWIGLLSLLWVPAWMLVSSKRKSLAQSSLSSISALKILSQRCFWFPAAGHFCSNYVLYFMVTWLPYYLVEVRGLSLKVMPWVASTYYACDAIGALCTGSITDLLARSGRSPTRVRKFSMAIGAVAAAICLIGCALAGPRSYLIWFMALGLSSGMSGWGPLAFSQTFAGPRAAGKWGALQNGFANFAGIVGPMITGFLVHWTGRFTAPLALAACVALLGAWSWSSVTDPELHSGEPFASREIGATGISFSRSNE